MASIHMNDKNPKLYSFSSGDERHISRSSSNVSRTRLNNGVGDSGHDTSSFNIMVTNGVANGGVHHTNTSQRHNNGLHHSSSKRMQSPPNIWTTSTSRSSSKSNFTSGSNDFHYIQASDINGKSTTLQNGSTSKLLPYDDQSNSQSKCSMFRGVILCLCLNLTYANVVRFPRELDRHGVAFLVPYLVILLFIGLPIILLEIALGQFLGQGSAHSWRASPILRGASIVGRLASWLGTITISLQGVLGMVYIGEILVKSVPFSQCQEPYTNRNLTGQQCMEHTFLTPVWENTLYFALLSMSLVVVWTLAAACTYSGTTLRRSIICIGLLALGLLLFQAGWETTKIINHKKDVPFTVSVQTVADILPMESGIWFDALVQVLFSTNIGIGLLPVVTGKFIYKGDAVRTSLMYISFNVLVLLLSTGFFMSQLNNHLTLTSTISFAELKPFTSIYDNAVENAGAEETAVLTGLTYLMIVLITIMTLALQIYTASRLIRRHPNYVMCMTALIVAITVLICPKYVVPRTFDTRIVGTFVICALIFDIVAIAWVYGARNIYTDLEFSIGRPISKVWIFLWWVAPISLSALLIWWTVQSGDTDLGHEYVPRWLPIAISMSIIAFLAFTEVYKQVDYNCCSMIREAGVSSKDWGPADPIVRHAWKQWTSVCEDTGQKDFTLRRRGTRDYTHSIKRGQRANGTTASVANSSFAAGSYMIKSSTLGRSSPKYNGSIFGDSAIEEDMSVANYPHVQRMVVDGTNNSTLATVGKAQRSISNDSRKMIIRLQPTSSMHDSQKIYIHPSTAPPNIANGLNGNHHLHHTLTRKESHSDSHYPEYSTRTVISTTSPRYTTAIGSTKPLHVTAHDGTENYGSLRRAGATSVMPTYIGTNGSEHICWRKYATNAEEFSTEL